MTESVHGDIDLPVVMCTWRRLDKLPHTIADLERQEGVTPHLTIWNNNTPEASSVEQIVRDTQTSLDIEIIQSPENIGGIGRFHAARRLAEHSLFTVFVDDDQVLPNDFLVTMYGERHEEQIHAGWAFKMIDPENYWNREKIQPGEKANYCATRGMIVPTDIFTEEALFDIPQEYSFIEDLWLSYYALAKLNFTLYKSAAPSITPGDQHGQWRQLVVKKTEFLKLLVARGWDISQL